MIDNNIDNETENESTNETKEELLNEYESDKEEAIQVNFEEHEKLKAENSLLKHKLSKLVAESENYRTRMSKESEEKIKYANQSLVSKLLPVLDNFDLALRYQDQSAQVILEGVEINRKVMHDILERYAGVKQLELKVGDIFNPEYHEAISIASNPELDDNVVANIVQDGYLIQERVLRAAKVQVNKKEI